MLICLISPIYKSNKKLYLIDRVLSANVKLNMSNIFFLSNNENEKQNKDLFQRLL